jgi:hypothetical protein
MPFGRRFGWDYPYVLKHTSDVHELHTNIQYVEEVTLPCGVLDIQLGKQLQSNDRI